MSGDVTKSCYPQCPVFGVITRQRQGQFWQQPLFNSQYSENTFIAVPGDDTTYFLRSQDVNLYIYILSDRVIMSSNFFLSQTMRVWRKFQVNMKRKLEFYWPLRSVWRSPYCYCYGSFYKKSIAAFLWAALFTASSSHHKCKAATTCSAKQWQWSAFSLKIFMKNRLKID